MGDLLDTLGFATLPSTLRCTGRLCRLDVSMFISIIMKLSCQLKTLEQWLVKKGRHSPTACCTKLPVYVEQGSTGSISEVDSSRYSRSAYSLLHPLCSRPPVARTFLQLCSQQSCPREPCYCWLVLLPTHHEVHRCILHWSLWCHWLLVPFRVAASWQPSRPWCGLASRCTWCGTDSKQLLCSCKRYTHLSSQLLPFQPFLLTATSRIYIHTCVSSGSPQTRPCSIHDRLAVHMSEFVQLTAFLVHTCINFSLCSSERDQIWNVDSWFHALDLNGELFFFQIQASNMLKWWYHMWKIELTSTALAKALRWCLVIIEICMQTKFELMKPNQMGVLFSWRFYLATSVVLPLCTSSAWDWFIH